MKEKKEVYKVKPLTEGKKNIIATLIEEYDIKTAEDIQEALKDLLGGTIKSMMEAEMDEHIGYEKYQHSDGTNYRNGVKKKNVHSTKPQIVKKRQKDISEIDQKIINMYARGLTTRQISEQIEDIYGFECSESFISNVTDKVLQDIQDWQNRLLEKVYSVIFIIDATPFFFYFLQIITKNRTTNYFLYITNLHNFPVIIVIVKTKRKFIFLGFKYSFCLAF